MVTYMKKVSVSNPSSNSTICTVSLKTESMNMLPEASLYCRLIERPMGRPAKASAGMKE